MKEYSNETLFIEFYYKHGKSILLNNGFSSCHNLCNNMVSIEIKGMDPQFSLNSLRNVIGNYKQIFITSSHTWEIFLVHTIAKEFPLINFTIGGPGPISFCGLKIPSFPPLDNLKISSESLEIIFPKTFSKREWGINLPEIVKNNDIDSINLLMCNTTRPCNWGKCKFCSINSFFSHINSTKDQLPNYSNYIPESLIDSKEIIISAGYPDTTLEELRKLVPIINNDKRITFYFAMKALKPNKLKEFKNIIKTIINPERLSISIGVEFFSNKMLKHINKGVTVDDCINTINLINYFKIKLRINIIFGWNNLTIADVNEFKNCLSKIDCSSASCAISRLIILKGITNKYLEDDFIGLDREIIPFYQRFSEIYKKHNVTVIQPIVSYHYILKDPEQIKFNLMIIDALENSGIELDPYYRVATNKREEIKI